VKAIRNRQVVKQPIGIFIWDRPTAEAAVLHPLWLAKVAYPELFKDIDMVTEVKRFYREIMAFNLTDDQAHDILNGAYSLRFGPVAGVK
jgi:iron complex transport system substrate-binding protein